MDATVREMLLLSLDEQASALSWIARTYPAIARQAAQAVRQPAEIPVGGRAEPAA